ncbi:MAG: RagB/SusD family nutrient uptake outer membrane protein [Bacteroidales bacterium]|nr:RagB/SusD family nutrient uptake outer membrane protein [Bacteroidales bacterium]
MKKLSFFLISLLLIITSCDKFYEEDLSSLLTAESGALSNEIGLNAALAGAYKPLASGFGGGLASAHMAAVLMGSDDLTTHKSSNKACFREFDQFNVVNNNDRLPLTWNGCYKTIQQCNNILANYETAVGNQDVIKQIAGEAYFLRGYSYFWITRLHGKAPLMLDSHIWNEDNLSIAPAEIEDIYDQIISDLQMAISLMADKKLNVGRAGKGSAKAVLAEVYLQMTGYPLKDVSKYALAASTAKDVIDNQATYGFGLLSDYAELWPTPAKNNDGHKEEVFVLSFQGTRESYNCWIGIAARPGAEMTGWDDYFCEIGFYNQYPDQYRKDVTFLSEWTNKDGITIPWTQFGTKRPYYKKLFGTMNTHRNGLNQPLERFAETLLIFAEAQIMATGDNSDPDALEAFNQVRRRAYGLDPFTPDVTVDATSITQRDVIEEKGWEFAGEFCRWFDLVRLEMVEETFPLKDPDELQPLTNNPNYFIPYPLVEAQVNPNLAK